MINSSAKGGEERLLSQLSRKKKRVRPQIPLKEKRKSGKRRVLLRGKKNLHLLLPAQKREENHLVERVSRELNGLYERKGGGGSVEGRPSKGKRKQQHLVSREKEKEKDVTLSPLHKQKRAFAAASSKRRWGEVLRWEPGKGSHQLYVCSESKAPIPGGEYIARAGTRHQERRLRPLS